MTFVKILVDESVDSVDSDWQICYCLYIHSVYIIPIKRSQVQGACEKACKKLLFDVILRHSLYYSNLNVLTILLLPYL